MPVSIPPVISSIVTLRRWWESSCHSTGSCHSKRVPWASHKHFTLRQIDSYLSLSLFLSLLFYSCKSVPAEESNRGEPWDLFPISVCSAERASSLVGKQPLLVLMAIYMSVPRASRVAGQINTRLETIWYTLIESDPRHIKSVHCKTAFIHRQRLANASSYLTYTLVHKYMDILIVIKFYIREIYF